MTTDDRPEPVSVNIFDAGHEYYARADNLDDGRWSVNLYSESDDVEQIDIYDALSADIDRRMSVTYETDADLVRVTARLCSEAAARGMKVFDTMLVVTDVDPNHGMDPGLDSVLDRIETVFGGSMIATAITREHRRARRATRA